MADYGTMQERIADEISDDALTNQIKSAIQSAIKFYERKRFYFNQTISSFTTVANQEYYDGDAQADIPNLITIDSMVVNWGNSKQPMLPQDFQVMDQAQNGQIFAPPDYYAYYDQKLRFYAIPDGAYQVTMAYLYRLPALSNDTDTNAWMTEAEELIRQRAKYILAIDVTHELPPNSPPGMLEVQALDALQSETRRRMQNIRLGTELSTLVGRRSFNIVRGF